MKTVKNIINALNQKGITWDSIQDDITFFLRAAETQYQELAHKSDRELVKYDLQTLTDVRHKEPGTRKEYLFTDAELDLMANSKLSDITATWLSDPLLILTLKNKVFLQLSGRGSNNGELRGQRLIDLINQEKNKDISLLNFLGNTARNPRTDDMILYAANAPVNYAKNDYENNSKKFDDKTRAGIIDTLLSSAEALYQTLQMLPQQEKNQQKVKEVSIKLFKIGAVFVAIVVVGGVIACFASPALASVLLIAASQIGTMAIAATNTALAASFTASSTATIITGILTATSATVGALGLTSLTAYKLAQKVATSDFVVSRQLEAKISEEVSEPDASIAPAPESP